MSTRANIIIKGNGKREFFYRHQDGYPSVVSPDLDKIIVFIKTGNITNTVESISNILLFQGYVCSKYGSKFGHYEPTTDIHGDIEYIYIVDLDNESVTIVQDNFEIYCK